MEKITFGRSSECDIVLDDKLVSRHHGCLLVDGKNVFLVDNDSKNGTYVNGKRVNGKIQLSLRDKVVLTQKKIPLDWNTIVGIGDDETILYDDDGTMRYTGYGDSLRSLRPSGNALVDIPSRMEINQNHAEIYRNAKDGADWKVPFKRNMGNRIGNAVGGTLGCIISAIIILAVLALLGLVLSNL